jgi:hypothetical protein
MTGRNSAGSLNLHQNPDETLHIRQLDNGLERPCGRWDENLGHFSSLVGVVVIARKLTYGNSVSDCRNQKYEAIPGRLVADDPVGCEPVSGGNSLLTGKFTGNCPKIWPFGEKLPARTKQNQLVERQFPTKWNRELIRAEQGIY